LHRLHFLRKRTQLLCCTQKLAAFSPTANGNGPLRHRAFQLQGLLLLGSLPLQCCCKRSVKAATELCNVQAPLETLWSQRKVLWSRRSAPRRVPLQQKKSS
jgi:hypothetical protein